MLHFNSSKDLTDHSEDLLLAYLTTQVNLSAKRFSLIFDYYETVAQALSDDFVEIRRLPKTSWLDKWDGRNLQANLYKFQEDLDKHNLGLVSYLDQIYPDKFKVLDEPPLALYYQGYWPAIQERQLLTVVGSRVPGLYAKQLIGKILAPICQRGVGVVSGLAYGIDTLAHQTAVDSQAITIGVIGSGMDEASFYPRENLFLKKQIVDQGGLVLSEYPPGTPPNHFNFPRRNRLLAVLTELTWVVQAGLKSGSLITALAAGELGKTVATTPGSIYDSTLGGNLKLLQDGASLVVEPEDILQILGLSTHSKLIHQIEPQFNTEREKVVWKTLSLEPQLMENLVAKTDLDIRELSGVLTILELHNLAVCVGENLWVRG